MCLERCAALHMAQLMPLPLNVSCFSKIQIAFTFLVPVYPASPRQLAVKQACACVCPFTTISSVHINLYLVIGSDSCLCLQLGLTTPFHFHSIILIVSSHVPHPHHLNLIYSSTVSDYSTPVQRLLFQDNLHKPVPER